MAAVQVVGAVGRDDDDRLVDQPREQVPEQIATGSVGPVQVLQDDQQWPRARHLADQRRDGLEELQPAVLHRLGRGPVRQRAGQIAALRCRRHRHRGPRTPGEQTGQDGVAGAGRCELGIGRDHTEQVDEGQVGQADVAEIDAVAGEHADASCGGPRGELVEQPRLAHTCVAGEEDGGGAAGRRPVDAGQQAGELIGPAHQRRVVPAWHGVDRGTDQRQDRPGGRRGGTQRVALRLRSLAARRVRVPRPEACRTSRR